MTREEYAKQINWNGTASRIIEVNELPVYLVGEKIKPGLCWTDGGEFKIETNGEYQILFIIKDDVDGHAVDYDDEDECEDLGCEDCYYEKEILIDQEFIISKIYDYDEETGNMEIHLIK
jgi:hypothetical protein